MTRIARKSESSRRLMCVFLLFCCSSVGQESSLTFLRASPDIVQRRLAPVPATQHQRIEKLRQQFRAARVYGPVEVTEQNLSAHQEPNLICTLPGSGQSIILVAADTAYEGQGTEALNEAQVNWATLEMLPLLVESVAGVASRHTTQFVAFNGASGKHSGVAFYLKQLSKQDRRSIKAVIELQQIGAATPSFAPGDRGFQLGKRLRLTSRSLRMQDVQLFYSEAYSPTGTRTRNLVGEGPITKAFDDSKLPAITMYSRDRSARFTAARIDPQAYYDTYLLLCAYLRQLDRDLRMDPPPIPGSSPLVAPRESDDR